jgi:hypothetical protein
MNRLFSIALLVLMTGATNAHAGYYHRVPNSSNGQGAMNSGGRSAGENGGA